MPPSAELIGAVVQLEERSGHRFQISPSPVPGTSLFVVHTPRHDFRPEYTVTSGVLGFRVPSNFPDASPEDSFFILPAETKLSKADPLRNSADLNRAARVDGLIAGSILGNVSALLFSWHIWNTVPWNRRTHTLFDHYAHCLRRFEVPENG